MDEGEGTCEVQECGRQAGLDEGRLQAYIHEGERGRAGVKVSLLPAGQSPAPCLPAGWSPAPRLMLLQSVPYG